MKQALWIAILALVLSALSAQDQKTKSAGAPKPPAATSEKKSASSQTGAKTSKPTPSAKTQKAPKNSYALPPLPKPGEVVATVNGSPILGEEVARAAYDWAGAEVVESLILQRVIEQEAKKQGVKVSPGEIEDRCLQFLEQAERNLPPGMELDDFLRRNRSPRSRVYRFAKIQLLAEKIVQKKVNLDEFVQYRQIVLRIPGNTPEEQDKNAAEVEKRIQEVYQKLKGGMDFVEAVKTFSEDTFTKDRGGLIEYQPLSFIMPDIANRVKQLKAGQFTEPFRSLQGYLIIKLEKTGSQATPQEKQNLLQRGVSMKLNDFIREAMSKANITNKIVQPLKPEQMRQPPARRPPQPPAPPRRLQPPQQPPKEGEPGGEQKPQEGTQKQPSKESEPGSGGEQKPQQGTQK